MLWSKCSRVPSILKHHDIMDAHLYIGDLVIILTLLSFISLLYVVWLLLLCWWKFITLCCKLLLLLVLPPVGLKGATQLIHC